VIAQPPAFGACITLPSEPLQYALVASNVRNVGLPSGASITRVAPPALSTESNAPTWLSSSLSQ
jgi:hypothetical protein